MVRRCFSSSTTDKGIFFDKQSWCGRNKSLLLGKHNPLTAINLPTRS